MELVNAMHHYAILFNLGNEWHTHPFSSPHPVDSPEAAAAAVRRELESNIHAKNSPHPPRNISLFSTAQPPADGSFLIFGPLILSINELPPHGNEGML